MEKLENEVSGKVAEIISKVKPTTWARVALIREERKLKVAWTSGQSVSKKTQGRVVCI